MFRSTTEQTNSLFVISFVAKAESGIAIVTAPDERTAVQILRNSGKYNFDPGAYVVRQARNLGLSASIRTELLEEAYVNALEASQQIENALAGIQGPPGPPGAPGEPGQPGTPGSDGKSAYQIAVENGYTGTEAQWAQMLMESDDIRRMLFGRPRLRIVKNYNKTSSEDQWYIAEHMQIYHPIFQFYSGQIIPVLMVKNRSNKHTYFGGRGKRHNIGWSEAWGSYKERKAWNNLKIQTPDLPIEQPQAVSQDNTSVFVPFDALRNALVALYCKCLGNTGWVPTYRGGPGDWVSETSIAAEYDSFGFAGQKPTTVDGLKRTKKFGIALKVLNPLVVPYLKKNKPIPESLRTLHGIPVYLYSDVAPIYAMMQKNSITEEQEIFFGIL